MAATDGLYQDIYQMAHGEVDVTKIIETLFGNADKARNLVKAIAPDLSGHPEACKDGCDQALTFGIITQPEHRDPEVMAKLDAVAGRVL